LAGLLIIIAATGYAQTQTSGGVPQAVRRDILGHSPVTMTHSYTHSGYEARERAVELVATYGKKETNEKYVKTRKASPRGWPPVRRRLLKRKGGGGRLELPTLGL